jgi:20S proteasome alpha/beta subunit
MEEKEMKARKEQLIQMRDALGSYFEKEDMEVGMVMSVLLTMLVETMIEHAKMEPHTAMLVMTKAVAHAYEGLNDDEEDDNDDTKGETQWLN